MTCTAPYCGTLTGYRSHGCRCPQARAASTRANKRYKLRTRDGRLLVDQTGSRRRAEALMCMGWPAIYLADRLGISRSGFNAWIHKGRIMRPAADKIAALYDELSLTTGPSPRARMWAERRGWAPPIAWDDDTIDDPTAAPACWKREGERRQLVVVEDVEWLLDTGVFGEALEQRIGAKLDTITQALYRAGRRDLVHRASTGERADRVAA